MRYNLDADYRKFAEIADAMGEDIRGLSIVESAELAVMAVENLLETIGIPKTLDEVNVDHNLVADMAASAIVDSVGCNTNPKPTSLEACIGVFDQAFKK